MTTEPTDLVTIRRIEALSARIDELVERLDVLDVRIGKVFDSQAEVNEASKAAFQAAFDQIDELREDLDGVRAL